MTYKIINILKKHFFITAFVAILLVVFSLYSESLSFDWVYLDDDVLILDKQNYLSFSNIRNIFSDTVFAVGQDKFCRPLLNCTFLLEKYIYKTHPFGYHLTNILIHVFASFFIFLLLAQFYEKRKSLIFSVLFAVHPAVTQAVVWVPGRNDSLLTLFAVTSFIFFLRYLKKEKIFNFILCVFLFLCSLLIKETAVIFPVLCIVFMIFQKNSMKNILNVFIWFSFVVLIYFMYRYKVLSFQTVSINYYELAGIFISSFPVVTKYIANIFFPLNLSVFMSSVNISYLLSLCSVLMFVLISVCLKSGFNLRILFGLLWFVFFLIPTFILPDNQFYDHRIYLPMAGILLSLSEIVKNTDIKKLISVSALFFIIFVFLSYNHGMKFENKNIFWVNAYMDSPDSSVTNGRIADLLADAGSYDKAVEKYMRAIELENKSRYYVNLSVCYLHMNKVDEAEQILLKALTLRQDNPTVYYNLAIIYKYKGLHELAAQMKEMYINTFNASNKYKEPDDLEI